MWNLRPWSERAANRLNNFSIPSVTDPVRIRIYWFKGYCFEAGKPRAQREKNVFHAHAFHELHFVLNGEAIYDFGQPEPIRVQPMQLLLIPPNCSHREIPTEEGCLRFSVGMEFAEAGGHGGIPELFREFAMSEPFLGTVSDKMLSVFEGSLEEVKTPTVCTGYLLRANVFHLLCEVLRQLKGGLSAKGTHSEDLRLMLAKRFVAENLGRAFRTDEVAAAAGVGSKQLGRIFRRYEKCSLTEYVHACRITEAKHLLNSTELSLREISERLGFSSEYYFNAFFKKHAGVTPGNYRKS